MTDPSGSRGPAAPRCAVVVEDDPDERRLIGSLLEAAGFLVCSCQSVAEATTAVRTVRADVVLTDLSLGGESGTELAVRLRAAAESADVPIVAVTGRVEPEWAIVRHFDAYVRKPIDPALLVRVVQQLCLVSRRTGRPGPP